MTIYEPIMDGTGVFSGGIGKDAPYGKQTGLFKPNISKPGGGRAQAIIAGARAGYNYFKKNPRFVARIGAVAGGAVVRYASDNTKRKTLRSVQSDFYSSRSYRNKVHGGQCCCRCQKRRRRSRRR